MNSTKRLPWFKWYPQHWRSDVRLHRCSYAARGLWADMLSLMGGECDRHGYLIIEGQSLTELDLSQMFGGSARDVGRLLAELYAKRVFSKISDSDLPEDLQSIVATDLPRGTIFSRRMVRDRAKDEKDKANGKTGGHPLIRRGLVPKEQRVRPFKRSDAPEKARRIFDRENGCCHWCHKPLNPDLYHIDHVIAVRDGGTNDEANLVASCPECNGARAMVWGPDPILPPDLMVGFDSDHNPKREEERDKNPPIAPPSIIDDDLRTWAAEKAPLIRDLESELESYRDWKASKGKTHSNERAGFRNWLKKAQQFAAERAQRDGGGTFSRQSGAPVRSQLVDPEAQAQRAAIESYLRTGKWVALDQQRYGAAPGKENNRMRSSIVAEYRARLDALHSSNLRVAVG